MSEDEPHATIHLLVYIHFACLTRQQIRDFAGRSVGKKRDLQSIGTLSAAIAKRLVWPLRFYAADQEVSKGHLANGIEAVLRAIPDEMAFLLANVLDDERKRGRRCLGDAVARSLLASYRAERVDRTKEMLSVGAHCGPTLGEQSLASLTRLGELRPRYKWRRTSVGFEEDFTGFDDGMRFGRIWVDNRLGPDNRWQWSCLVGMARVLNSPSKGAADIPRQAARDVEDHYDALKRLNNASA
jgi:hypothetical protein